MNLYDIKGPEDIKKLNLAELNDLAGEIRAFLIESIAQSGGHLSSNLGIVEVTLALHYVFDSPKDKLIFDVVYGWLEAERTCASMILKRCAGIRE